jgi:hypothetical protein
LKPPSYPDRFITVQVTAPGALAARERR